jgi:hypothetical protein
VGGKLRRRNPPGLALSDRDVFDYYQGIRGQPGEVDLYGCTSLALLWRRADADL